MHYYWFLLATLGVWRITHLLASEEGPWKILERMRAALGSGVAGEMVKCFYCLSLWIAAPFAWFIGQGWGERLLLWPALSGGAILLERITDREGMAPAVFYEDDQEETEDVLRKQDQTSV